MSFYHLFWGFGFVNSLQYFETLRHPHKKYCGIGSSLNILSSQERQKKKKKEKNTLVFAHSVVVSMSYT